MSRGSAGLHYDPAFVSEADEAAIVEWLATIRPLWEERYSARRSPRAAGRRLLRPVYWLGSWQFACLDYYRPSEVSRARPSEGSRAGPPDGVRDRCVAAEPFPPVLARLVARVETIARRMFRGAELPAGWKLNVCLVNLYGDRVEDGRRVDAARVGEHKDLEPGPVASISIGERALFEFVASRGRAAPAEVVLPQWLDGGSLLLFGGDRWKRRAFHRVLRVDRRGGKTLPPEVAGFETRRVNFTFRFVPDEHVVRFADLSAEAREDVRGYVVELARGSEFWKREVDADPRA